MIKKILVIHGPNLNLLGEREPGVYGNTSISVLNSNIIDRAKEQGLECEIFQSNHEGAIIDKLQEAYFNGTDAIIINPGAYTHYSYAIHDALKSLEKIYKIEIHISDINSRESFRSNSVTAPACDEQIVGHGLAGYLEAIDHAILNRS